MLKKEKFLNYHNESLFRFFLLNYSNLSKKINISSVSCLGSNLTHQSTPKKFDIWGTFEQISNKEKWPITWPICPFPDVEKINYANGLTCATGQNKPNNPSFGPHSLLKFSKWRLEVVHWVLPYVYAQSYTLLKLLLRSGNTSKSAKSWFCRCPPKQKIRPYRVTFALEVAILQGK